MPFWPLPLPSSRSPFSPNRLKGMLCYLRSWVIWQDLKTPNQMLRFTPSESVFCINGKPSPEDGLTATYSIDWSKKPVTIDFMPRHRGGKLECILKLEGDRLTLSIPRNSNQRPTDFDSGNLVVQFQRIKLQVGR